jgi:ElaB/YqjD/DUF883 family membrane-anchored ribosome-binding protein
MSSTQQEIKAIRKNVDALQHKMAEKIDAKASDKINSILDPENMSRLAQDAGKSLSRYFRTKKKQAIHAKESCEKTVKKHPFAAATAAFSTGLLIAFLFKKK